MATERGFPGPLGITVSYDARMAKEMEGVVDLPFCLETPLRVDGLNGPHWIPLPLTHKLGLPLRYMKMFDYELLPHPNNPAVQLLSLDLGKASQTFGQSLFYAECEILFSRADHQDLDQSMVKAMLAFVKIELGDVVTLSEMETDEEEEKAEATSKAKDAAEKATAENFAAFSTAFAKGSCKVCGMPEAWKDTILQVCSTCKGAKYCSKDCQKNDWATHKKSKMHKEASRKKD